MKYQHFISSFILGPANSCCNVRLCPSIKSPCRLTIVLQSCVIIRLFVNIVCVKCMRKRLTLTNVWVIMNVLPYIEVHRTECYRTRSKFSILSRVLMLSLSKCDVTILSDDWCGALTNWLQAALTSASSLPYHREIRKYLANVREETVTQCRVGLTTWIRRL